MAVLKKINYTNTTLTICLKYSKLEIHNFNKSEIFIRKLNRLPYSNLISEWKKYMAKPIVRQPCPHSDQQQQPQLYRRI